MQSEPGKFSFKSLWAEAKWLIIAFLVLFVISLPCCCFLGYRTNWILWQLGLR